jgi:hypothetical protein
MVGQLCDAPTESHSGLSADLYGLYRGHDLAVRHYLYGVRFPMIRPSQLRRRLRRSPQRAGTVSRVEGLEVQHQDRPGKGQGAYPQRSDWRRCDRRLS